MKYPNQNTAFADFKRILEKKGEQITQPKSYNKARHWLIKTTGDTYYILYRRSPFILFFKEFEEFIKKNPDFGEVAGESINFNLIDIPIKYDAKLIFIYENGSIKWIFPKLFKKFAMGHKLIRKQDRANVYNKGNYSGKKKSVHEVTISVPFSLLKDFEKE